MRNSDATPQEVKDLARAWFTQQMQLAERRLGKAWDRHADWVREYLVEQVRQRLIQRGWRPRG